MLNSIAKVSAHTQTNGNHLSTNLNHPLSESKLSVRCTTEFSHRSQAHGNPPTKCSVFRVCNRHCTYPSRAARPSVRVFGTQQHNTTYLYPDRQRNANAPQLRRAFNHCWLCQPLSLPAAQPTHHSTTTAHRNSAKQKSRLQASGASEPLRNRNHVTPE
jgi:hypothetical protein